MRFRVGAEAKDFSPEHLLGRAGSSGTVALGERSSPRKRGRVLAAPVRPYLCETASRRAGRRWTSSLRPRIPHTASAARRALQRRARFPGNAFLAAPRAARNGLAEYPGGPSAEPWARRRPGGYSQRGGLLPRCELRILTPRYPVAASPELPVGPLVGPWLFPPVPKGPAA